MLNQVDVNKTIAMAIITAYRLAPDFLESTEIPSKQLRVACKVLSQAVIQIDMGRRSSHEEINDALEKISEEMTESERTGLKRVLAIRESVKEMDKEFSSLNEAEKEKFIFKKLMDVIESGLV